MAPKNKFTKEEIIDAAFDIAKVDGLGAITVRKVAQKLNSSIAPIYVNFNDIDELIQEVVKKAFDISRELIGATKFRATVSRYRNRESTICEGI